MSHQSHDDQNLLKMEALVRQSVNGLHLLFDNASITRALQSEIRGTFDLQKMKQVQEVLTELIRKPTYRDKLSFLNDLDEESHILLIRTYFTLVENALKSEGNPIH